MTKKITIRLYRQHDMDLMNFYRVKSFRLSRQMKRALVAYAAGEIYVPDELDQDADISGYMPKSATFHISFNDENPEEARVLALLDQLHYGYISAFTKAVFRSSCSYLPLLAFSVQSGVVVRSKKTKNELKREAARNAVPQMKVVSDVFDKKKTEPKPEPKKIAIPTPVVQPAVPIPAPVVVEAPKVIETPKVEEVINEPVAKVEVETPVVTEPVATSAPGPEEDLDALFMQMSSLK